MKIKVLNRQFEIKAKNLGTDKPYWDNSYNHYKFRISIKNLENNETINFLFWDSIADFEQGKTELTEEDLIYCFKFLLTDAISYLDSNGDIDEFQKEFGYEKISECIKAYNGCKKQYQKCLKLGLTENEIYDLLNAIIDKENDDKLLELKI
jgi:hypothetical protein